MLVSQKRIIVTGGGNGMGREMVLLLLRKNAQVVAVDMNEEALKETERLAGGMASALMTRVLNITDKEAVESFSKELIATSGGVDGLINNAGIIQPFVRINDLEYSAIDRVMNVNFFGSLYMIKAFLPHFLTRPEAHIVNISSMGGFLPVPGQSIYGASKAAVKLMTEGLASELSGTKVHVTIIFPGAIATNIMANSGLVDPNKKSNTGSTEKAAMQALSPVKAAELIIEAMEKNKIRACVGKDSKFLDLLYRLNPNYAMNFITKKMKDLLK